MKFLSIVMLLVLTSLCEAEFVETGCWFLRDSKVEAPPSLRSIRVQDFAIYAADPQLVVRQEKVLERSIHFLQTELGWKFPYTRKELTRPVLDVYFVAAGAEFTGTVRPGPVVLLNESILSSQDFPAHWIHYLAHASEMMYRDAVSGTTGRRDSEDSGVSMDHWFYEATAGWMEGQFGKNSHAARVAQYTRRLGPQIPLDDATPDLALGASLLLDLISRPYRDVIRQTWEQWSYAREERVLDVLGRVLQLNHLPSRDSYLLNYFLRTPMGAFLLNSTTDIVIQPYSAAVIQGGPEGASSGGVHLSFQPKPPGEPYSASLIYHGEEEKEGILAIKESLSGSWTVTVPYAGMVRYKMVVVNGSGETIRGTVVKKYDAAIPAVLDYFRASAEQDGGVQLEWKTTRENGVAFWNLYRISNGTKERLNALPIPASIDSPMGLHYIFIDYANGAFYSLEAITGEGFPSTIAVTTTNTSNSEAIIHENR